MNFLKLKKSVYAYLGFHSVAPEESTDAEIDNGIKEVEKLAHFRYSYKYFETPPSFLNKQPYTAYLKDSTGVILSVMTLGGEIDRRINIYGKTDKRKAVIFDACASALLEELSDEYERQIADNLSYRFCPGYGGSGVEDLQFIFGILQPEKIGVSLTESGYMLPCKSMAGIIAVGGKHKKNCGRCVLKEHCLYIKEGTTCYNR